MATYNSKRTYNKKLPEGGANYNSGPFAIIILDKGSGIDNIKNILANVYIDDNGLADDNIVVFATLSIKDSSTSSTDSILVTNNVTVSDLGNGNDYLESIIGNVNISDYGLGNESSLNITGAFFVIDSNNMLQPLGVLVTNDSRYELLPATRDYVEEIPGRHGEFDFGTEFKAKALELHVVTDEGYEPLQKAHLQRLFAKYLDPTKGYKTLIFSDDVEKTYIVKYSGKIDISNYPSWFEFVIPFKMSEPFIIGSIEKSITGTGTAKNDGTFETGIVVEIKGPATNPSLTIGTETMSYTGTIATGQTLVIDTDKKTAKIGSSNVIANYNGKFPMLQPGETLVTSSSNITIRWRDRWL